MGIELKMLGCTKMQSFNCQGNVFTLHGEGYTSPGICTVYRYKCKLVYLLDVSPLLLTGRWLDRNCRGLVQHLTS